MDFGFTTAAYVVAAVFSFCLLGGLSGQEKREACGLVWYCGHGIAVFATFIGPGVWSVVVVCRVDRGGRLHRVPSGAKGADDADAAIGGGDAQFWLD